ncbi:MAG: hypothetical protein WBO36_01775, partial [Saprospiraceae bacterium]
GLVYIGYKGFKNKSVVSYSILFYLVTLSIVSNIVINLGTFMNERFIFMASLGFCILIAYGLSEYLPSKFARGKEVSIAIALSIVLGFAVKSYVRVPVWKDEIALNGAAVAVSPNSARANSFLSTAYFEKYRVAKELKEQTRLLDAAEKYAMKSLEIYPDYQNANLMLIGVAAEKYKLTNDINDYVQVVLPCVLERPEIPFIKEFGDYLKGRGHDAQLFPFYLKIGTELLKFMDKRRDYAAEYLKYAYEIQPASKEVNEALAKAYELSGNIQESQRYKTAAQSLR